MFLSARTLSIVPSQYSTTLCSSQWPQSAERTSVRCADFACSHITEHDKMSLTDDWLTCTALCNLMQASRLPKWSCPKCLKNCSCSYCRKASSAHSCTPCHGTCAYDSALNVLRAAMHNCCNDLGMPSIIMHLMTATLDPLNMPLKLPSIAVCSIGLHCQSCLPPLHPVTYMHSEVLLRTCHMLHTHDVPHLHMSHTLRSCL